MSREVANIAAAGLMTAAYTFGEWGARTARYVDQIRPAFSRSSDPAKTNEPFSILLDNYIAYLRDMAELPQISVLRFYGELARLRGETPRG